MDERDTEVQKWADVLSSVPGTNVTIVAREGELVFEPQRLSGGVIAGVAAIGLGVGGLLVLVSRSPLALIAGALFAVALAVLARDRAKALCYVTVDVSGRRVALAHGSPRLARWLRLGPVRRSMHWAEIDQVTTTQKFGGSRYAPPSSRIGLALRDGTRLVVVDVEQVAHGMVFAGHLRDLFQLDGGTQPDEICMSAPHLEPVGHTSQHFSARDWEFVRRLRAQLTDDPDPERVAAALAEFAAGPRNGLVASLETEIRASFGLSRSEWTEWRLRPEYEGLAPGRLADLLVERLDAITPEGPFTMPPPLFESHLIAVEVAGVRTPARELKRREWDYIVAESTEPPGTFFVEFLRGSVGLYTEVKIMSPSDGAMVQHLSETELDRLVDSYR